MQKASGLAISEWIKNKYTLLNQGNLSEQFVAQEIAAQGEMSVGDLFFWERQARGSSAEVDYLIPVRDKTIPVEVKSGTTGSLKSLHLLLESEPDIPFAIKTSANNFSVVGKIRSLPLYAFPVWLRRIRSLGI